MSWLRVCFAFWLSLGFALTASCPAQEKNPLVGTWRMRNDEITLRMTFKADKSFSLTVRKGEEEQKKTGKWSAEGTTLKVVDDEDKGESEYTFLVTGDSLTLTGGDLDEPLAMKREAAGKQRGDGEKREVEKKVDPPMPVESTTKIEAPKLDPNEFKFVIKNEYEEALDRAIAKLPAYAQEPELPTAGESNPELTTADAAFAAFTAFWKRTAQEKDYWRAVQVHALAKETAGCSEDVVAKRVREVKRKWIHGDGTGFTWGDFVVENRSVSETEALFTTWNHGKLSKQDLTTLAIEHSDFKEPYAFAFKRSGDQWKLTDIRVACSQCSGGAACPKCSGSGRASGGACRSCGGSGKCSRCGGKAMVSKSLDHTLFVPGNDLYYPAPDWKPRTELGTPKEAAEACMDGWLAREVYTTQHVDAFLERELPILESFLEPTQVEVARKVLAMKRDEGKRLVAGLQQIVETDKVIGETAFAKVDVVLRGMHNKTGLGLEKRSESWIVTKLLDSQCVMCAGKGQCIGCKGSGEMAGIGKCLNCEGRGYCKDCGGFGMVGK